MCVRSERRRPEFESPGLTTRLMITLYLVIATSVVWGQTLGPSQVTTEPPQIALLPSAQAQSALPVASAQAQSALPVASAQAQSALPAAGSASAASISPQLSVDYDYVYQAPSISQSQASTGMTTPRPSVSPDKGGLFYPLYGEPSPAESGATQSQTLPLTKLTNQPGTFSALPGVAGLGGPPSQVWGGRGEMGEQNEWLRERLRTLRKFHGDSPAASAQLEILQKQFPGLNLTQMYNSPVMYGDDGFRGYMAPNSYGAGYAQRYGQGYGDGYGERYGEGYGERYGEGYRGYGERYGEGYGGYGQAYGEGSRGYGEDWYYYNGTWHPNYEFEDWYYHNGTWHMSPGDWEDGYYHNGTWYPGLDEMDDWYYHNGTWYPSMGDWEDGYFHNGTWYPGLEDMMEDGYFYNGTWYPGMGDVEDGYYYNGTWYPGYEREGPEQEDLMWWQLHHPRWSDQGPLQQRPPYVQVPPLTYPNTGPEARQWPSSPQQLLLLQQLQSKSQSQNAGVQLKQQPGGNPLANMFRNRQTQRPGQTARSQPIPGRPMALPVTGRGSSTAPETPSQGFVTRRPTPPGYVPRGNRANQRSGPRAARLTGHPSGRQPPPPPPPFSRRRPPPHWKPPQPDRKFPPAPGPDSKSSGSQQAGLVGGQEEVKFRPSSPLDPYRSTATVTMGIAIACLIGLVLIIAPLLCLLHKYRQEKRVKKRTFLRRAEHGSIDEGIMDAMVMTELGERKGSRVSRVGSKGGKTVWKGARPKTGRSGQREFLEIQPLEPMSRSDRELTELYSVIP